ncbi:hypothetical protein FDECE_378 [Fusarium decemcellulare]|nr:hypothetical protein FDECE_378 [Fusarium decemcellulare]
MSRSANQLWRMSRPALRLSRIQLGRKHAFSTTTSRQLMGMAGFTENQLMVREAVSQICSEFPNTYWQERDQDEKDPKEFHAALAKDGWLGIALPESLGGSGLGISEATMMMQTITESGAGMAGAQSIHANVYATQPLAKFGSQEQLETTVPNIVTGKWRVCFGVTEPNAGLDTLRLGTTARKNADGSYSVTGQKIWITCAQVASKMILLARTTPLEEVKKPSEGLSLFSIDLDRNQPGLDLRKIKKMGGRAVDANEVFFDNYQIPANSLIGEEGKGFKMILHGMNAERCLLAGEALGLGYAALKKASEYARERVVFKRPIGMNQAIAHPLADAYMKLEGAKLATYHAARLYDQSKTDSSVRQDEVGVAANSAKYMAAEAAFTACERAVLTHGGMGYAMEYDVERWFRECLVPRIAPVSREMILNFQTSTVKKPTLIRQAARPTMSPSADDAPKRARAKHACRECNSRPPGTLFFGESNFLTLVPGRPRRGEQPGSQDDQSGSKQKARLLFPINSTPQSMPEGASPASIDRLSEGTSRYLRDEGALTLPDLQACIPALQAYFTWFHPCFPILDRADFTRKLAASEASIILLQSMLFIGATYCDNATITSMGFSDRSEAKSLLYTRARLLFHADWEKDEITLIQSLFLMSFWRGGPSDVRDVRYWLGVVIGVAESYGLHRSALYDQGSSQSSSKEANLVVHICLPSRIRDDDCDIEPLSPTDLESEADSVDGSPFGSCKSEHITYAIKMVEIARILGRVIDVHFAPGRQPSSPEQIQDVDEALEEWRASLPEEMNRGVEDGTASVWAHLLHLAYNHLRILIYRHKFVKQGQSENNGQIAVTAASKISRIAEDMLAQGTLRYGQMHLITSLFAALCIHAISIRRGVDVSRRIAEHRAQMCLLGLQEIQKYWKINNNVLDLFLQYLDVSIAQRLHGAAQSDAPIRSLADLEPAEDQQEPAQTYDFPTPQTQAQTKAFEDQYFNLLYGPWEGDDGMADLGLVLQANDPMQMESLNILGPSYLLENFADKSVVRRQLIDANQLQKLALTFGRPNLNGADVSEQAPVAGTPVPEGYHLAYFTPNGTEADLGADGTDRTFNASAPFTRRMWAGGKMTWTDAPLRVDDEVEEKTRLLSAVPKKSRSAGEMVLVEVEKEFWGPKGLAVTDRRSWVFRPEIDLNAAKEPPKPLETTIRGPTLVKDLATTSEGFPIRELRWSPVGLFRFSALTFNGHMIHYNEDWTRNVEDHPGLVVHGPLNLINLLHYWKDVHGNGKGPRDITYRAMAPVYAGETYNIRTAAVRDAEGRKAWDVLVEKNGVLCMKSEITA